MKLPIMVVGTSAPQRRDIVKHHFGGQFEMVFCSPDIDEKSVRGADPESLTKGVAEAKMTAILQAVARDADLSERIAQAPGSVAVTFDQVVVWGDEVREKPLTGEESRYFISCYSDSRLATVQTTVLYDFVSGRQYFRHNDTMTYYGTLSAELIERVVARGVCMRTAGAFVVEDVDMQSRMIRIFPGSVEEVMGVSASVITEMLRESGSSC